VPVYGSGDGVSEHSFDLAASSLQSQIARGSVARFLDAYAK
jgi:hypothetical protein